MAISGKASNPCNSGHISFKFYIPSFGWNGGETVNGTVEVNEGRRMANHPVDIGGQG